MSHISAGTDPACVPLLILWMRRSNSNIRAQKKRRKSLRFKNIEAKVRLLKPHFRSLHENKMMAWQKDHPFPLLSLYTERHWHEHSLNISSAQCGDIDFTSKHFLFLLG